MFDFVLEPEQKQIRDGVRVFTQTEIIPVAEQYDRQNEPPLHIYQKFFEAGWMDRFLSDESGKPRHDLTDLCILAEELAYGCAGIAGAIMVAIFSNRQVAQQGSAQTRAEQRQRLADKKFFTAFSATEQEAGSDLLAIQTKAQRSEGGYILNGSKAFCSNIRFSSHVIVMARVGADTQKHGSAFSWFLVPTQLPGITVGPDWETLGLRSMSVSPIQFDNVELAECDRLGQEGQGLSLILQSFNHSRTLIAAMAVGIARRARDEIIKYSRQRKLYGDRLFKLQDYRFHIVEMEKDISAARALVWLSALKNDRELDNAKENGIAKLYAGQMAMRVAGAASMMMGGLGYTRSAIVEKLLRDARYIAIIEGPEPVQKELIFAEMLRRNLY